ncbi:MAG: SDR family NAD(P)-dependent oxidoreductase [Clostridia bacterium]|nr:SDR family NAD(P)-dependent oxidoreductase [Clostridia bacterium]
MNKSIAVITGATDGIGLEAAKGLLKEGFFVIGTGRNIDKTKMVEESLKKSYGENVKYFIADLSLMKNARQLYKDITAYIEQSRGSLTLLINNAGCYVSKKTITEEGFEKTEAVNYLAPFLLSHLFMPQLKKSEQGKIINTGSRSHYKATVNCTKFTYKGFYFGYFAYRKSKLKLTMMTQELNSRYCADNFRVYIADPGLVNTYIVQKSSKGIDSIFWSMRKRAGITVEEGASTAVFLAKQPISSLPYHYYYLCKPKNPSKFSQNPSKCSLLYEETKKILSAYLND